MFFDVGPKLLKYTYFIFCFQHGSADESETSFFHKLDHNLSPVVSNLNFFRANHGLQNKCTVI